MSEFSKTIYVTGYYSIMTGAKLIKTCLKMSNELEAGRWLQEAKETPQHFFCCENEYDLNSILNKFIEAGISGYVVDDSSTDKTRTEF